MPLVPYPLGGAHEADNFEVEDVVKWYAEMGEILSKDLEGTRKAP